MGVILSKTPYTSDEIQIQGIMDLLDMYLRCVEVSGRSPATIDFYTKKLLPWACWLEDRQIYSMNQINAEVVRNYLAYLQLTHNPGGVHGAYRSIRSFLRWYELETDARTGIHKVKLCSPKPERLEPVPPEDIIRMLEVCGVKEKAILLFLYDTGIRAREWSVLTRKQYNMITGEIVLTDTKNGEPRKVWLGAKARRAMRAYLLHRNDNCQSLFSNRYGEPYKNGSIQHILAAICKRAGTHIWYPHAFRRSYALNCLRSGVDIFTLQLLMGHKDLQVLRRYLKQTEDDLRLSVRFSPGDHL
jgi:integrase/recombinase XerD